MLRVVFSTCFVFGIVAASAHGNIIKGFVSDSLSGHRLTGANVVLDNHADVVITDVLGNFRFDGLDDGTYTLRFSFIGYRTETVVITVSANETHVIEVKLSPSALSLDEVTVTDSSDPQQLMTTINRIDIGIRPLRSSQDVLRMIPGLVTAQHAGGGKAEQIFLRGFDIDHGTDITLSVDGMPVNMVSHAHGQGYADLHFVIPETISEVHFDKGPYYASVGDFNTAGFANFITLNTLDKSRVKLEAGRFDTYRALGMFKVAGEAKTNTNAYIASEYQYTNGPFVSPQNFNRVNVFGKLSTRIAGNKFLTASLSTFRSKWDASGQVPQRAISRGQITRFGSLDDTEGGSTGRSNATISLVKFNEDGSSFTNRVYLSNYDFELYSNFTFFLNDPVDGDQIKQKERRNIYGYLTSYNSELHFGRRHVDAEFGVGIRYDDVSNSELSHVKQRNTFLNAITLGDIDQMNANAYANLRVELSNKLKLDAGVRMDFFSFAYEDKLNASGKRMTETATIISPKLNLSYDAGGNVVLYLKSGYGFHSNDARVVMAQEGRDILPKAFGSDVGFFAKPFEKIFLNLAVWQLNLEQEFVYVGDEAVVEEGGESQRYGIDLSIRYQVMPWLFMDLDGNYAHGRSVDSPEGEDHIPLAPTFTGIGGLTANLKNGIRASLRYRWVGDRPANEDNSVTAKGYFLLDAALTYTRRSFELSMSASNLLNREWNEAQFDTETFVLGDSQSVSELTFTPGDPFFVKGGVTFFF